MNSLSVLLFKLYKSILHHKVNLLIHRHHIRKLGCNMTKSKRTITLLPLIMVCFMLLLVIKYLLQMNLSDVTLFAQYTSPMETSLKEMTQVMDKLSHSYPTKGMFFHVFVIGGIFSISMTYLLIYMANRSRISALYFSLAGILLGVRLSFTKETLFMQLLYDFSPEAMIYWDLLTGMIALLFFFMFYCIEFIDSVYKKYMNVFISIMIIYIIILIVFPLPILIQTFFVYQILSLIIMSYLVIFTIITVIRTRSASYLNFIGFFVLFALSWNDVLEYSEKISTNDYIMFGVFVYFIFLSIHVARSLTDTYVQVESLTGELQLLNTSLEMKVKERTEQLLAANLALKREEETRRRLLTNVSHELNTPLAFIQGYVKAMLDEVIPRTDTSYLRAIYDDTKMMSHMIQDLQELSIIEMGHLTFRLREVNISVFMEQLYVENQTVLQGDQIDFFYKESKDIDSDSELVQVDPVRIKQVVNNLIVNARKFTPKGGKISIQVHLTDRENCEIVIVSVTDNGEGIKEEDLPYVFERLYKADTQQNHLHKGSGLGLAIAKEIIEFHQGEIAVDSVYGKGSTFNFILPLKGGSHHNEGESLTS